MSERSLYIKFSTTERFDEINYNLKSVVREAIIRTLDYEDFIYDAEVSVTFCDNEYIRKLNKKYRNKDKATDVLSFPLYDFNEEDELVKGVINTLTDEKIYKISVKYIK
jgi:probable rRNA maturation factor